MVKKTNVGGEQTVIAVSGAATVRVVDELRSQLLTALERGKPIGIDVRAVERADLSFLQLLFSASNTASARGVRLSLIGDPEIVLSAAAGAPEVQQLWSE